MVKPEIFRSLARGTSVVNARAEVEQYILRQNRVSVIFLLHPAVQRLIDTVGGGIDDEFAVAGDDGAAFFRYNGENRKLVIGLNGGTVHHSVRLQTECPALHETEGNRPHIRSFIGGADVQQRSA